MPAIHAMDEKEFVACCNQKKDQHVVNLTKPQHEALLKDVLTRTNANAYHTSIATLRDGGDNHITLLFCTKYDAADAKTHKLYHDGSYKALAIVRKISAVQETVVAV